MPIRDRATEAEKRWTLVVAILISGTVFLSGLVVNMALPAIGEALQTGLSGLQWGVDGYISRCPFSGRFRFQQYGLADCRVAGRGRAGLWRGA